MSSHGNGQPKRYNVLASEHIKLNLEQLHEQSLEAGTSPAFMTALRQIGQRLQDDPSAFGEPLYRLPALRLQIRQAVILPLVVIYGVHEEEPLVFIRGFKVLS
jgi:hypothetical protein